MTDELHDQLAEALSECMGALFWASGSNDFQFPDGPAVAGWKAVATPAIRGSETALAAYRAAKEQSND